MRHSQTHTKPGNDFHSIFSGNGIEREFMWVSSSSYKQQKYPKKLSFCMKKYKKCHLMIKGTHISGEMIRDNNNTEKIRFYVTNDVAQAPSM